MTAQDTKQAVVDEHEAGSTLAAVVRGILDGLPWSKCRKLIATGRVEVDGSPVFDAAVRVQGGELVTVNPTGRRRQVEELDARRILHVDHDLVVVDKPPGLISVPFSDSDRDHLLARTQARLALMEAKLHRGNRAGPKVRRGPPNLYVVQRLDKDTSGVLVFARNRKAKKALENQLRKHSITRVYKAITLGRADSGTHESFLMPDAGGGKRGSWRGRGKPPKQASRAVTHIKRERILRGASLVSCELETGRQHQIRIHLAEAGTPLIGERVYTAGLRPDKEHRAKRPMLHAEVLGFKHPADERFVHFRSELPTDFQAVLSRLDD